MKRPRGAGVGVIYSSGLGVLSLVAGILLLPVILSSVGAGSYGVWLFLVSIASYFAYSDLGVGTAIVHFGSRIRGGDTSTTLSALISAALLWTVAIALVALPVYGFVAWSFVDGVRPAIQLSDTDARLLVGMAIASLLTLVLRPFSATLQAAGEFLLERKFQLVGLGIKVVGTIAACLVFRSVGAVAVAESVALIAPGFLSMCVVLGRRIAVPRIERGLWVTFKRMTHFSVRSLSVSLTGLVILQGGTVIVGLLGTPAQVTYYNAAFRIYSGVRQLNSWTVWPFQSTLSRLFAHSHESAEKVVRSITFASFFSVTLVCGALIPMLSPLVEVWIGTDVPVEAVATTAAILLAGLVLNSLHGPLSMASDAAGRPGIFFPVQLLWAVSFIGLAFALEPAYGIVGVALALSLPLLVIEPIYILMSRSLLGMTLRSWWSDCIAPVLAIAVPSAVLAIAIAFFTRDAPRGFAELLPSVGFAIGASIMTFVRFKTLPVKPLRAALQSDF